MEHKTYFQKHSTPLYIAMQKYDIDNFKFEVVEECSVAELNEKEVYYIQLYKTQVPNGYNIQMGGSCSKLFPSEKILNIIDLLENSDLTFEDISILTNYDLRNLFKINSGQI